MIEYKGYIGHFTFDEKVNLFHGKVSNINDLITFQGKSVKELHLSFQHAVNAYIEWRKKFKQEKESLPENTNL